MRSELKDNVTHSDPDCPGGSVEETTYKGVLALECGGCQTILYREVAA